MRRYLLLQLVLLGLVALLPVRAMAGVTDAGLTLPCPRYPAGSTLVPPKDLFSTHGVLRVDFLYQQRVDAQGTKFLCFSTPDGAQSPTLHLNPGDELILHLRNDLPASAAMPMMPASAGTAEHGRSDMSHAGSASGGAGDCIGRVMTDTSTNLHFHGTNAPPICHQDEVIHTMINSGETFEYDVHIPADEPPGLYWYHPHVHEMSEEALQDGASGAIVIEGIERAMPEVAGLPQRVLVVRDNVLPTAQAGPGGAAAGTEIPAWDLSLNYTPVAFPAYTPVVLPMRRRERQLWRVLNASADTILDLEVRYDGAAQSLRVVALDGVPVNSQDGLSQGRPISRDHLLLPPAGRAEFVVQPPPAGVKLAQLVTRKVKTGSDGDMDPERTLATIRVTDAAPLMAATIPVVTAVPAGPARFAGLRSATPVVHRKLFFSEVVSDPHNPNSKTDFFITVDGQTPVLFAPGNPPSITTTVGAVEEWTVENRALENHEFHIHQIHFLVLAQNGVPVEDGQMLDTIDVPFWSGSGPFPSVTLRLDFRGVTPGDFVYHCHILGHEDAGMMAMIRVLPRP